VPLDKIIRKKGSKRAVTRNPDQTRRRILEAALKEFSERGFAGGRVDVIARAAKINKRMLYHYFGDKEGLFRAVVAFKLGERLAHFKDYVPAGFVEGLPDLFRLNCEDADWVRLTAWESLQSGGNNSGSWPDRRRNARFANQLIRQQQAKGQLRAGWPAEFIQLAVASLAMFPHTLPQMTRAITGRQPSDRQFQRNYARFLETIAAGFRP
jgi:TetR/AcrR family transcriptional regulator